MRNRVSAEQLAAIPEHPHDGPIVYYLGKAGSPSVLKIGTTTDTKRRFRQYCTGKKLFIPVMLAWEPGSLRLEGDRHVQFKDYHLTGEWFWAEGALWDHVEGLR